MSRRVGRQARHGLFTLILLIVAFGSLAVQAAPYAAMVMDARTGEVLHSRNADTRLHPASLTKMMTLYIAFEAVKRGEISLDTKVTVSKKAAAEPPSKLGLRAGQKIALRYLIRAAAVKSANDASTAIAEAISGSEAAFARRMNRTAKALGMTRTTFKNAHGLTEAGHLSTARDMTIMGRRLFFDYPQYYNLFSRRSTDAGGKTVNNTNRRLLGSYRGADGIKTGYTRAAGFNLVASAERGQERIIATVFGGRSTATRNARVAELLDMGFQRAPSRAAIRKPPPPAYGSDPMVNGTVVYAVQAVEKSAPPRSRPWTAAPPEAALVAMRTGIDQTLALIDLQDDAPRTPFIELKPVRGVTGKVEPLPRPVRIAQAPVETPRAEGAASAGGEVVTRLSTSGGRNFGITVGRFATRHQAERMLLQTALIEVETLDEALRKVVARSSGFDANFMGLSEEQANLACRRLTARAVDCAPVAFGPS